jgi:hypothetical protein
MIAMLRFAGNAGIECHASDKYSGYRGGYLVSKGCAGRLRIR